MKIHFKMKIFNIKRFIIINRIYIILIFNNIFPRERNVSSFYIYNKCIFHCHLSFELQLTNYTTIK